MSGRRRDVIWYYYDEKQAGKLKRTICKKCGKEMQRLVNRIQSHVSESSSENIDGSHPVQHTFVFPNQRDLNTEAVIKSFTELPCKRKMSELFLPNVTRIKIENHINRFITIECSKNSEIHWEMKKLLNWFLYLKVCVHLRGYLQKNHDVNDGLAVIITMYNFIVLFIIMYFVNLK